MLKSEAKGGYVEIVVDGGIEQPEFDATIALLEREIAAHGRLNVVEIVRSGGLIAPSLWWRDLSWAYDHLDRFGRVAVVTDHFFIGPISRVAGALLPVEMRTFPAADLEAARVWAKEGPSPPPAA